MERRDASRPLGLGGGFADVGEGARGPFIRIKGTRWTADEPNVLAPRPHLGHARRLALGVMLLGGLAGCDLATIPSTAEAGLGRPAVEARVSFEVEGLPGGIESLELELSSLAIRRTRDQQWIPLLMGATDLVLVPDEPVASIIDAPLGADTYDRVEIIADAVRLRRQGRVHEGTLDREDATLAVQWVLHRDVDVRLCLDYRADVELTADSLDVSFAPLAHLQ